MPSLCFLHFCPIDGNGAFACKYNQLLMYLGDASELQSHLNNDWTAIFKDIKTMEDLHFHLLTYSKRTLAKQRIQDEDPFINDQINHHHQQITHAQEALRGIDSRQAEMAEKYEAAVVSFEGVVKLMGRVGARLLETYQASIDKCKSLDEELIDKHLKMKAALVRILNQKDRINLQETISLAITYSRAKLANQVDRLAKIVLDLENGNYQRIEQYKFKEKQPPLSPEKKVAPAPSVSMQKPKVSVQKAKVSSVGREERSPGPGWQQMKAQERTRRAKQKVAVRLVHGLYSMMDLARHQLIEDITSNERQKAKRLYNQIFSRNKFNHEQIVAFQAKREEFQIKVALFKERMEQESRKIEEALRKPSGRRARKQDNLNFTKMEVQPSEEEKAQEAEKHQSRKSSRYRIQSPKSKGKPNEHPLIMQCSQENFDHIKFQATNQSAYLRPVRNKLPFLYSQNVTQSVARAASYDQRPLQHSKNRVREEVLNQQALGRFEKMKREERYMGQRAKMPLKNIEVRVDGAMRQDESREVRNLKPNPMEYTFYVRRSNRFYEPNHNIIF